MRGNPTVLATAARIERAENIIAACIGICRAVEALAERQEVDEHELLTILRAVALIKATALEERNSKP